MTLSERRDFRLTDAQVNALSLAHQRLLVVVWHGQQTYPRLGLKPWFALSGGVLPTQLHTLWLAGLIRLDRRSTYELAGTSKHLVGRARLTPAGLAELAKHVPEEALAA